jgi:hypothetical protein
MKHRPHAHVPSAVKTALQETADRLGGVDFDTVVTAASWAFCMQGEALRQHLVAEFWYSGPSALEGSRADRRRPTLTEIFHALGAYCYAALRRCVAR